MTERDHIFTRIREALVVTARREGVLPDAAAQRGVLPAVGATFEEQVALFEKNAADLRADFRLLPNRDAALAELLKLRDTESWKKIGTHKTDLTNAAAQALNLPVLVTDAGFDARELEQCDAGITECDALIAQTGSVLVTNRSAGGRALSVLPPHHVVLARRDQLIPDLPTAFALVRERYAANYPSMISLITGPSRTGDIERILVLGAHGPKKLTILCF